VLIYYQISHLLYLTAAPQSSPQPHYENPNNAPREIPIETHQPPQPDRREDWRGPWPHDNLGPKPRIVGGKIIKPKLIDY